MSVDNPRFPNLRHPGEILKELATETRIAARWAIGGPVRVATSTVLAAGVLFLGYYVITGAAGDYSTNQSPRPGSAAPEPGNGLGMTIVPTVPTSPPETPPTPSPEPPKPKGTVSPAIPTATSENENKVAPVEIFPKEMDPYIEIVDYLNPKNDRVLIVGIKGLPEGMTEVSVSAPISGKLRNATNDPNWAAVGDLNDPTLTSFAFTNFKTVQDKSVQPGNNIGILTDKDLIIRLGNNKYIATVDVYTKNPLTNKTDWEKANEIVKQFFPRADVVTAEYNPATASSSDTPTIKYTVAFEDEKPAGLK